MGEQSKCLAPVDRGEVVLVEIARVIERFQDKGLAAKERELLERHDPAGRYVVLPEVDVDPALCGAPASERWRNAMTER